MTKNGKIEQRTEHCFRKRLNTAGRCIADCVHTKSYEIDCIGMRGRTLDTDRGREIPVTMGFIDGRGVEVDEKGYKVSTPSTKYTPDINHNCSWGKGKY